MVKQNVIVDGVSGVSPSVGALVAGTGRPSPRFVTVSFQGGQTGFLDMALPRSATWSYVLDSLRQANEPVYVEVDPATNVITELLIPLTVTVDALRPAATGDAIEVDLFISQAKHYLRRSNPDFQRMLGTLQAARDHGTPINVTETPDSHEIIDVRLLPQSLSFRALSGQPPPGARSDFAMAALTRGQAQEMFDLVNAKSCCPSTAAAPCITFLYPDDGCWGRAHEMCRLMIASGVQPRKVWIYGDLRVSTKNQPTCAVHWGWHVAPTLQVDTGTATETQVIDPSLFSGPVSQVTWVSVQGDPSPTVVASDAAVFHRRFDGTVTYDDAAYTETKRVLDTYRRQLLLRSTGTNGPPPYINCLARPPGVQFFGTIGPSATQRWFTWGWPASWHVFWTIMPITQCRGAPQLTWSVQVERANGTQCTYWITVRNLTAETVRFEGRYDVLSR